MRTFLLFALTCRLAFAGAIEGSTEVPNSRSPDGKFALYYENFPQGEAGSPEYAVYFRDERLAKASAQINPDFGNNYLGKPGVSWKTDELNTWDTQELLNMICRCNEFHLRRELFDSGFFYSVTWTSDSQWVVIEGGAHKFWHMAVYHFVDGQFRQIDLAMLSSQIKDYFAAHMTASAFQELGVNKSITAKWGPNHESHYVIWLGDGRFAVLGYPFLLLNGDFVDRLREKGEIYFVVTCQDPPHARVVAMTH
jgi:hypothetical protein